MSRNDACQNLSGRLWRHIFYNWRQRPTYFMQLFSMIKFSNAWYLLWSNHGCFILLSVFPVLDYLPSFISSSQLQGLLVADTWQFICMKDVSQWVGHGLDHLFVSSVCMDSQSPSGRKGPQEVSGPRRVRAEFRSCCTRLCPLGSWKPPRWLRLLGNFLLHPRRLHWGPTSGDPARWIWPEEPS